MEISLKSIALLLPLFVTLFWGVTIFLRNHTLKNPGFYMAMMMLLFFILFLSIFPFYTGNMVLYMRFEPLFFLSLCLVFPMVYFYIRSITCRQPLQKGDLIHFLPALILAVLELVLHLVLTDEVMERYAADAWSFDNVDFPESMLYILNILSKVVVIIQIPLYFMLCHTLVRKHRQQVDDYFSGLNRRYFNWIYLFYSSYPGASLLGLYLIFAGNNDLNEAADIVIILSFSALSGLFFVVAFIANHQRYIENGEFYAERFQESSGSKSDLRPSEDLLDTLNQYFISKKPYLNPELKITDVAYALNSNRTYISHIIKESSRKNFRGFINQFRVKEVMELFQQDTDLHFTTRSLSEQAGFNNYNTFVNAFRKETGLAPGKYRQNISRS